LGKKKSIIIKIWIYLGFVCILDIALFSLFILFKYKYVSLMPKLIDNYVLNRKIGAGQYGEVYKGYDRATNNDIAVKAIKRENVHGKL
jgi:serine/threonine protein kinase